MVPNCATFFCSCLYTIYSTQLLLTSHLQTRLLKNWNFDQEKCQHQPTFYEKICCTAMFYVIMLQSITAPVIKWRVFLLQSAYIGLLFDCWVETVFLTHVGICQMPTWLPTWKAKSFYRVGNFLPTWFFLPLRKFRNIKIKLEKMFTLKQMRAYYIFQGIFKIFSNIYALLFIFSKL